MATEGSRHGWGDVAKGVGILAIVTSHVIIHDKSISSGAFKTMIGLTAMPTFFVLSGLMFKPAAMGKVFRKRVRSIAIPYCAFLLLVTLLVFARDLMLPNPSMPHLWQFLWGGAALKGDFGTFWFLSALFFTQLLYNAVASRFPDPAGAPLLMLMVTMVLVSAVATQAASTWSLPLSIDRLPYTIPLFWFGHLLQYEGRHRRVIYGGLAAIALAVVIALTHGYAFRIALKGGVIEPPVLGLLAGFLTARVALSLYKILSTIPGLSDAIVFAGRRSLVILCLHQFVHFTLRRLGVETSWILIAIAFTLPALSWGVFARLSWTRAIFLGTGPPRSGDRGYLSGGLKPAPDAG